MLYSLALEFDFGTLLKWIRLISILPPQMDSVSLWSVEREVMIRSKSAAACECGSRMMISARSDELLVVLRGGEWLGLCSLFGVMFHGRMDMI